MATDTSLAIPKTLRSNSSTQFTSPQTSPNLSQTRIQNDPAIKPVIFKEPKIRALVTYETKTLQAQHHLSILEEHLKNDTCPAGLRCRHIRNIHSREEIPANLIDSILPDKPTQVSQQKRTLPLNPVPEGPRKPKKRIDEKLFMSLFKQFMSSSQNSDSD